MTSLQLTPTGYVLAHNGETLHDLTREQVVAMAARLGVLAEVERELDLLDNQEERSDGDGYEIDGQLEIHHERGVIYFHSAKTGWTVLRICCLPRPIPDVAERQLDVTHMTGTDWGPLLPQSANIEAMESLSRSGRR